MDTLTQSTSTSIAWQYKQRVEVTPKGLIIKQVIGTTSSTSQNPQFNSSPNHAIVWRIDLMHKTGYEKRYDQSVTCLQC